MTIYGQVVVGFPGSGKTTYCNGMQQYLRLIGRKCYVVNLDPANEYYEDSVSHGNDAVGENKTKQRNQLPYETIVDVCEDMVSLSSVATQLNLGPNGGLLYCMEYIHRNVDHLVKIIRDRVGSLEKEEGVVTSPSPSNQRGGPIYLMFDFPGQAELFTHCSCVKNILSTLVKELDLRLCAVQLTDAHFCAEADKFISAALLCTSSMIRLELPMVNVLSKIDLLQNLSGSLPFNLEFFTDMDDIGRLVDYLDSEPISNDDNSSDDPNMYADDEEYQEVRNRIRKKNKKYRRLHESVCEVIDDFGLLNFIPLDIQDVTSVSRLLGKIDKCNGYLFTHLGSNNLNNEKKVDELFKCAVQSDEGEWKFEKIAHIQEHYTNTYGNQIRN